MNKVLKSILLVFGLVLVASCSKSDSSTLAPLRDYEVQKAADMASIETFMKTHYMTVTSSPGTDDDMDVTYTVIPAGGTQVSIWDQTDYPRMTREVTVRQGDADVVYNVYYLMLREGSGAESKSPCNVDSVLAGYRGEFLSSKSETVGSVTTTTIGGTEFEENRSPSAFLPLTSVIRGWSEVFPKLKTGTYTDNADGTITYGDFGAAVLFIPSGLAYFRNAQSTIPVYSPLVFSVKLFEIQRNDQDGDGIFSYQEDINNDGYVLSLPAGVVNPDDSDGDGIPDFLDSDDDGDGFLTKYEIKNLADDTTYTFENIPTCGAAGNGKKRYLDPTCHN
ncbi:FKBP-type peptidyl-prolyl cis-trans isomerase [Flavobacterium sp.]